MNSTARGQKSPLFAGGICNLWQNCYLQISAAGPGKEVFRAEKWQVLFNPVPLNSAGQKRRMRATKAIFDQNFRTKQLFLMKKNASVIVVCQFL